jgi:hypothetical protein
MIMADRELGPGERALKAQARFRLFLLIGCTLLGGVLGGILGIADAGPGKNLFTDYAHLSLSPVMAVLLAIGFLIGLVGLPLYLFSKVDELKVLRNMQSMVGGWFAVIGGFPAWQLLSAGGLAPPPSAIGLFLLAYGFTLVTFVVLKFRD